MVQTQRSPKKIYIWVDAGGWSPGANTLLYLPLNSTDTYTDKSGNSRTVTNVNNSVTFGTNYGVDCGVFNTTTSLLVTPFSVPFANLTVLVWSYCTGAQYDGKILDMRANVDCTFVWWSNRASYAMTGSKNSSGGREDVVANWDYRNQWVLVGFQLNNKSGTMFIRGANNVSATCPYTYYYDTNITPDYINVGNEYNNAYARHFSGYLSNLIMESKVWTSQEIDDYFNQTKATYGIS